MKLSSPRGQITPTKAKSWAVGVSHDAISGGMSAENIGRVVMFDGNDTALEIGIFGKKFGICFLGRSLSHTITESLQFSSEADKVTKVTGVGGAFLFNMIVKHNKRIGFYFFGGFGSYGIKESPSSAPWIEGFPETQAPDLSYTLKESLVGANFRFTLGNYLHLIPWFGFVGADTAESTWASQFYFTDKTRQRVGVDIGLGGKKYCIYIGGLSKNLGVKEEVAGILDDSLMVRLVYHK